MKLLEKEKNIEYLFKFFNEHENDIVKVVFETKTIERAQLDTMYENEDKEEDEYNVIIMKNLDDNSFFEISYHNVPLEIIFDGNNIVI